MGSIRQYLLTVTAAAVFCGILTSLTCKMGTQGVLIKLLTGLFMAITIISPWKEFDLTGVQYLTSDIACDSQTAAEEGIAQAENQIRQIILEQTRTYIMDKADALDLDLSIDVILSKDTPAVPQKVTISGHASPYAKSVLSNFIETNLNIPKEDQEWT